MQTTDLRIEETPWSCRKLFVSFSIYGDSNFVILVQHQNPLTLGNQREQRTSPGCPQKNGNHLSFRSGKCVASWIMIASRAWNNVEPNRPRVPPFPGPNLALRIGFLFLLPAPPSCCQFLRDGGPAACETSFHCVSRKNSFYRFYPRTSSRYEREGGKEKKRERVRKIEYIKDKEGRETEGCRELAKWAVTVSKGA